MTELATKLLAHNQRASQTSCDGCPYNDQYLEITGESFAVECEDIREFDPDKIKCGLATIAVQALANEDKANFPHLPPTAEERGV